ncbi:hypothetical protein EBM89_05280 [Cellulomonas triticagri]|uniref:Uncharacterized protein n=1 Tax=Cellulomonas triticagri TaxID=2483352 RepID=A0A3M2JGS0_9CELL|nr:hypothetical protein EBM89_05280 [Cellulomonas triticagri]
MLTVHDGPAEDFPVFTADAAPIFFGPEVVGADAVCGSCGLVVLAGVRSSQFVGVLFACPRCRAVVAAHRTPGAPVLGDPVVCEPGTVHVDGAPRGAGLQTVIGRSAWEAYTREVGRHDPTKPEQPRLLTSERIAETARWVRDALGPGYAREKASYDRGRGRGTTPPRTRNRVVELVEYALQEARRSDAGEDVLWDPSRVFALELIREHLERWRNHPSYEALVKELLLTNSTRHTVAMLMAAGSYVDHGISVEFIEAGTGLKRADFWLYPGTAIRVGIEVKAPSALWSPTARLSPSEARKLARRRLREAISQLDRSEPSMLLLAGFDLSPANWDVLREATALATNDVVTRENFLATTLMNVHHTSLPNGLMAASADMHVVRNPLAPGEYFPEPNSPSPGRSPQ